MNEFERPEFFNSIVKEECTMKVHKLAVVHGTRS